MIDIHSHILHGLDDGPQTFEESLAMVRMAADGGTTDIVATPHANNEFRYDPPLIEQRLDELRAAVGASIKIHRGCDFHLTPENIQDAMANPAKYSIGGRGYLLVEFSDFMVPGTAAEIFLCMLQSGLRPVITHPERNPLLQKKPAQVAEWVELGCAVQVTAASLLGRFGKRARAAAEELMRRDLVHFLASDAHDCTHRHASLDEAWRHTCAEYGEAAARTLLEKNPRAALEGSPLPAQQPASRKRRFWF